MSVNPYTQNSRTKAVTPWSTIISLTGPGLGCDGLFNLYESLGDRTAAKGNALVGANVITTLLDGPEKVVRYGELEVGNGSTLTTLTASQRCKGLVILCDKLTVTANATIHMNGKGARVDRNDDPFFPFIDYKIPFRISLASSRMSLQQALYIIKEQGLAPWDQGTFQHLVSYLHGFILVPDNAGATALMTVAGCGAGASYRYTTAVSAGTPGNNGTYGGTGGGGGGGHNFASSGNTTLGRAGNGCPYSGGSGNGGVYNAGWSNLLKNMPTMYSGPGGKAGPEWGTLNANGYLLDTTTQNDNSGGGGAGNPGGRASTGTGSQPGEDGTGGKLTIICRGTITVNSGSPVGKIEANGCRGGGSNSYGGGGGSGGGHISLISPTVATNSGTIQCLGGIGGSYGSTDGGTTKGGDGGKGSVGNRSDGVDKYLTFSDLGWV